MSLVSCNVSAESGFANNVCVENETARSVARTLRDAVEAGNMKILDAREVYTGTMQPEINPAGIESLDVVVDVMDSNGEVVTWEFLATGAFCASVACALFNALGV